VRNLLAGHAKSGQQPAQGVLGPYRRLVAVTPEVDVQLPVGKLVPHPLCPVHRECALTHPGHPGDHQYRHRWPVRFLVARRAELVQFRQFFGTAGKTVDVSRELSWHDVRWHDESRPRERAAQWFISTRPGSGSTDDSLVQPGQLDSGIDAELARQDVPSPTVDPQCLGTSPAAVKRGHEEAQQPFPQRVRRHQCGQLVDELITVTQRELVGEALLLHRKALLIEVHGGHLDEPAGHTGESRATPQRQCLTETRDGRFRLTGRCQPLSLDHETREGVHVYPILWHPQRVAYRLRGEEGVGETCRHKPAA
jgi:hypothetical protein